jgi:hypothetical protein
MSEGERKGRTMDEQSLIQKVQEGNLEASGAS